ncbi:MAG: HEAT repeat domain-containing protein [Mariniblastus sp.]|nr:HEAT repeat domain-containing protein [Mariniblastus sp.]
MLNRLSNSKNSTADVYYAWLLCCIVSFSAVCFSGCAEGPLWKAGKYSPWARNQWAAEEAIADTLFTRKRKMTEAVAGVQSAPIEEKQRVAEMISEVIHRDSVLLLRIHGVNLLGQLDCPASIQTLGDASRDNNSDIRIAAVKAWQRMPSETAIPQLQEMIGSDTDVDVRLAATRALGDFSGKQAIAAVSLALDDNNPALQLRAAESLGKITGEQLGRDIGAWQQYVGNISQSPNSATSTKIAEPQLAEGENNQFIRE